MTTSQKIHCELKLEAESMVSGMNHGAERYIKHTITPYTSGLDIVGVTVEIITNNVNDNPVSRKYDIRREGNNIASMHQIAD